VHAKRYVLAGLAVGLLLVILASFVEGYLRFGGELLAAQRSSPLLWLVDTAPVVVAFLAWMVGRRQDEVMELEAARTAAYTRTAAELQLSATSLFQSVSAFSAMTADTAASVQETTQTMASLSQTAMRAALTAETVVGLAQKSARSSEEGLRAVEATTGGIARLAEDVKGWASRTELLSARMRDVFTMTAVLSQVADRSQVLAAEARAEAEAAGPAGLGFARVAAEMAVHAGEARRAAAQGRALLVEVEQAVNAALAAMEAGRQDAAAGAARAASTGTTIRGLATVIRDSAAAAREIATVAQQQDRGIEESLNAMNGIYLSVQEAVSTTARVAAQARALSDLAAGLQDSVQPPA